MFHVKRLGQVGQAIVWLAALPISSALQNVWHSYAILQDVLRVMRNETHTINKGVEMSTDKKAKKISYKKQRYVDITLSQADKVNIKKLVEDDAEIISLLSKCAAEGYSLTIKISMGRRGFTVLVNGAGTKEANGYIMSSSAQTPMVALAVALYKLDTKVDWGKWAEDGDDDDGMM